jgi:hypothetical protein
MIPTSFQLYFNKNPGPAFPWTVYIDNIRVGMTEDGIPGDYNDDGNVDAADYVICRKFQGTSGELPNNPSGGVIDMDEFNIWRENFGGSSGGGNGGAVPEPASALMLLAGLCYFGSKRRRVVR